MTEPLRKVTSSTTVKQIDEAIEIWKKVGDGSNSAQINIRRLQESRQKLIGILQREYNAIPGKNLNEFQGSNPGDQERFRNDYKKALINLMRDNYKPLSLSELNTIKRVHLKNAGAYDEKEITTKIGTEDVLDLFEGKKDITFASVIKIPILTAAVSLLAQTGSFSLLATVASGLWTFNPVIAICAGVVGLAGLGKIFSKVFGPELKTIIKQKRMDKAYSEQHNNTELASFDTKNIIEESDKKEKEKSEVDAQNNQLTEDLVTFKPKSIDEVIAFVGQFDKLPEADVVNKVKAAGINFEQMFKAEAFDLISKNKTSKIGNLEKKFANYLTTNEMQSVKDALGIKDKNNFSEQYKKVKADTATSKNKTDFQAFRGFYNEIIKEIVENKNPTETLEKIKTLQKLVNDNTTFDRASAAAESKNLKTLCDKMIQMLKELQEQVVAKGIRYANDKEAKKSIAEAHGLKSDDLENLLN